MKRKNKPEILTEEVLPEATPVTPEEAVPTEEPLPDEVTPAEEPAEESPAEEVSTETEAETEPEEKPEKKKKEKKPKKPKEPKPKKEKKSERSIFGIFLPLVVICIGVALMLAAVNGLTKDTIAAAAAAERENAILSIFPEANRSELYGTVEDTEVYLVLRDNTLLGVCISLSENGFGGHISMMVGKDTHNYIEGVQIVSMSETPNIGTKTKNESFLSQFTGKDPFVIGENVDTIARATVSSKAVIKAVNRALSVSLDFGRIAAERNLLLPLESVSSR